MPLFRKDQWTLLLSSVYASQKRWNLHNAFDYLALLISVGKNGGWHEVLTYRIYIHEYIYTHVVASRGFIGVRLLNYSFITFFLLRLFVRSYIRRKEYRVFQNSHSDGHSTTFGVRKGRATSPPPPITVTLYFWTLLRVH